MASEGKTPRKGREPPTIDAMATEVKVEAAGDAAKPSQPGDKPEDAGPAPVPPIVETQAAESAKPLEPPAEPDKPDAAAPEPAEPPLPPSPPPYARPPRRRSMFWPMLGSAILGAILALAVLAAIWRYNVLEPYDIDLGGKLLTARLMALEAKVRDSQRAPPPVIAARPPAPAASPGPAAQSAAAADTKALDDLAARIAKLEAAAAAPRPPTPDPALAGRLGALESSIKPLSEGIAANNKRDDELVTGLRDVRTQLNATAKAFEDFVAAQRQRPSPADKADLDKLDARMATLETATKSLAERAAALGAADKSADRNLRAAVLASALRSAVERGAPYAAELAALKPQVSDPAVLAPLEPFAAIGVPSAAALARELAALMPAIMRTAEPQKEVEGNLLQRLKARASEFVQVRPVGEAPGDDPAAVAARIAAEAARQDLASAVADLAKLPPAARKPADALIAKVQARDAAIAAAQRVAADALAALGKS